MENLFFWNSYLISFFCILFKNYFIKDIQISKKSISTNTECVFKNFITFKGRLLDIHSIQKTSFRHSYHGIHIMAFKIHYQSLININWTTIPTKRIFCIIIIIFRWGQFVITRLWKEKKYYLPSTLQKIDTVCSYNKHVKAN